MLDPFGETSSLFLVVSDIEMAHAELAKRGVEVSEIFHRGEGPGRGAVRIPSAGVTPRSPHSATPMATSGCFRKLQPGYLGRVDANVVIHLVDRLAARAPAGGGGAWRTREANRGPTR